MKSINRNYNKKYNNIVLVILLSLIIGILIFINTTKTLNKVVEDNIKETAEMGASVIEREIISRLDMAENLYMNHKSLNNQKKFNDNNSSLLNNLKEKGLKNYYLVDSDGKVRNSDLNIKDASFFNYLIANEKYISAPENGFIDNKLSILFGIRLEENLYAVMEYDIEVLSQITDNIRFGSNGNTYILNSKGETIAHDNRELVLNKDNDFINIKNNSELEQLVELEKEMIRGNSGSGSYLYNGIKKYMGYTNIAGTDWSIAIASPHVDIFDNINQTIVFLAIVLSVFIIIIVLANFLLSRTYTKLEKEQKLLQNVIKTANILIIRINSNGVVVFMNQFARKKLGYRRGAIVNKRKLESLLNEYYIDKYRDVLNKFNENISVQNFELAFINKKEQLCYVEFSTIEKTNNDEFEIMGIDISKRVISEKKLLESHEQLTALYEELTASQEELNDKYDQLRENDERYSLVVDASNIGIWEWDFNSDKRIYSDRWKTIFGFNQEEAETFENWKKIIYKEDLERYMETLNNFFEHREKRYECEYRIILKDGSIKWILAIGKALWNNDGSISRMAGSHADITKLKDYQFKLKKMAYYDDLTDLPNRAMLNEHISLFLKENKGEKMALLFLDFDNFKVINDTLGHAAGDYLLTCVGQRLEIELENKYPLFRLGGDEFVVLVFGDKAVNRVEGIAKKIFKAFKTPYDIHKSFFNVTASMGIAIYPKDGNSLDELLKNADIAMYKAKELGKNRYEYFNLDMNKALLERSSIEKHMSKALENEEMMLYYQPQISMQTGEIEGFEALIRWQNESLGFILPEKFIKIAEENKQIVEIGNWVLEEALYFLSVLNKKYKNPIRMSINLSVLQLLQENFEDLVKSLIYKYGLKPENVELEVTETILISNFEIIKKALFNLQEIGVKIALDDFGKGYSSLSYLVKLPIDILKIDRIFIAEDIEADTNNLTDSIIKLGHKMGMRVIAEGVETEKQLEYLKNHNCDIIQGYYYSKPMPESEIFDFIEKFPKKISG